MTTERELQNARRDYERQIREAKGSWLKELWDSFKGLFAEGESVDERYERRLKRDQVRRKAKDAL